MKKTIIFFGAFVAILLSLGLNTASAQFNYISVYAPPNWPGTLENFSGYYEYDDGSTEQFCGPYAVNVHYGGQFDRQQNKPGVCHLHIYDGLENWSVRGEFHIRFTDDTMLTPVFHWYWHPGPPEEEVPQDE